MKLVNRIGREIQLNPSQTADYLSLVEEKGKLIARSAAFNNQLPSQITPEMIASRKQARYEKKVKLRDELKIAREDTRYLNALLEALKCLCHTLNRNVSNIILRKQIKVVRKIRSRWVSKMPRPVPWKDLALPEKSKAMRDVCALLKGLNANQWGNIKKQLVQSEDDGKGQSDYSRLLKHANVNALANLI